MANTKLIVDLTKYKNANFDTLWQVEPNKWIVGFFCQGFSSLIGDGFICFLPLQGRSEETRASYLSPICSTPQEAIDKSYELWHLKVTRIDK